VRVGRRSRLVARLRSLHDYVSIALPYVVECKPTLQWAETDKLIDVEVAGDRTSPAEATTRRSLMGRESGRRHQLRASRRLIQPFGAYRQLPEEWRDQGHLEDQG